MSKPQLSRVLLSHVVPGCLLDGLWLFLLWEFWAFPLQLMNAPGAKGMPLGLPLAFATVAAAGCVLWDLVRRCRFALRVAWW